MAIALVSHLFFQIANTHTSASFDSSGATLMTVELGTNTGTSTVVSDNKGNTYVKRVNKVNGSVTAQIYDCLTPTVGTGHTVTVTNSSFYTALIQSWSGFTAGAVFDTSNSNSTTGTSCTSGSVTPAASGSLLICIGVPPDHSSGVMSVDSGFTIIDQAQYLGGVAEGGCASYLVQTSATAENPSTSGWTSGACVAAIAVYRNGTVTIPASAAFAGAGVFAPHSLAAFPDSATFTASGVFAPRSSVLAKVSATFAGNGVFAPHTASLAKALASFAGSGVFAPHSAGLHKVAAAFSGSGVFAPHSRAIVLSHATFAGSGAFLPVTLVPALTHATFAASGVFLPKGVSVGALYVPLITILKDMPIPVSALMTAAPTANEADLPDQLSLETILNISPIPMSGTMSEDPAALEADIL